jgi:hypothetical protein
VRAAFASSVEFTVANDATALCGSRDGQAATQGIDEWSMRYEYLSADRGLWILVGLREQLSRGT